MVPPQDRGWGDQAVTVQARGEALDQRSEHGPVSPVQSMPRTGSAEYRDLVAQYEELDVFRDKDARPSSVSKLRS